MEIEISIQNTDLEGVLEMPRQNIGLVIFVHDSGSGRKSEKNSLVTKELQRLGMGTLHFDLLTEKESGRKENRFNIEMLTERLIAVTKWCLENENLKECSLGYFGASTGSAAALSAAAFWGTKIKAVVTHGGRPDLAMDVLDLIESPTLLIVDSIQTMSTSDLTGLAGSVGQVKECAYRLLRYAKENNIPLILVGHVTKEGTVAGPAVLAHIVDTVLWFEGEKTSNLRLLRSVKNRFGATDEVGIFQMEDAGLIPLDNPEKLFLDRGKTAVAGSVVSILMEGTRSILVEIQSLVVPTKMAFPRRVAQGIDSKRLEMLLAVLFRRAGIPLYDSDVFVNVAGGIKANDPSVDLAICLSIASSYYDKALPKDFIAIGEVGLLGEVRPVPAQEKRIRDSKRLGFKNIASSGEFKYLPQVVHNYLK